MDAPKTESTKTENGLLSSFMNWFNPSKTPDAQKTPPPPPPETPKTPDTQNKNSGLTGGKKSKKPKKKRNKKKKSISKKK